MGLSGHKLIKGTLILTIAGFLTRIIGFVYKIYLADILGAKMLGIYQLVFPVYSICFTIYGAGIQTAISQVIASNIGSSKKTSPGKILAAGIALSMTLAVTLSFLVFTQAEWVASHVAMEPGLTPYLRILSILFPFCSLSACINGYYYGIQEAKIPAITQIVEQIARVLFVMGFAYFCATTVSQEKNCAIAVGGLVAGEIISCLYNSYQLFFCSSFHKKRQSVVSSNLLSKEKWHAFPQKQSSNPAKKERFSTLLWLAATLTATKLFVSILHSIESLLLPAMLRRFGCSSTEALSIYGVLTGMSLSFIFFPSTITNSFAVMLLPSIADAHARKDVDKIRHSVTLSVKYSLLIGLLCTCVFLLFGKEMGQIFFHNADAGSYLTVLSWLCPFLYLTTTLTSIINGMKKTQVTFLFTVISVSLKILILVIAVPVYGIRAYLVGLLASQLIHVILECGYLFPYIHLDAVRWICVPGILLSLLGCVTKASYEWLHSWLGNQYNIVILLGATVLLCSVYTILLFLLRIISRKDVRG